MTPTSLFHSLPLGVVFVYLKCSVSNLYLDMKAEKREIAASRLLVTLGRPNLGRKEIQDTFGGEGRDMSS